MAFILTNITPRPTLHPSHLCSHMCVLSFASRGQTNKKTHTHTTITKRSSETLIRHVCEGECVWYRSSGLCYVRKLCKQLQPTYQTSMLVTSMVRNIMLFCIVLNNNNNTQLSFHCPGSHFEQLVFVLFLCVFFPTPTFMERQTG